MGNQTNIMPIAIAKQLKVGDTVFLRKWTNKKDGSRRETTAENAIIAEITSERITFRNLSSYYKEGYFDEYTDRWSVEPAHNSYDIKAQNMP